MGHLNVEVGPRSGAKREPVEPARPDWDFLAITFRLMIGVGLWIAVATNLRPAVHQLDPTIATIQTAAGLVIFAISLVGLAVLRKAH